MNIEELKKIVRGNGFQESHGSTTIVIDVETVIDLIDEYKAINYTRCCTELKDDLQFERKSSARVFNNQTGMWEFI